MEDKITEVLEIVCKRLKEKHIKYVIGGSASLFLQGIGTGEITDIDIMTTKENAFKINKIFKEFEAKPVEYVESKLLRSYWGQLEIKGVKVDVMGEFSEKIKDRWINISDKRLKNHEYAKLEEMSIPVTKLGDHLGSYKTLNRKKDAYKVKEIEHFLARKK